MTRNQRKDWDTNRSQSFRCRNSKGSYCVCDKNKVQQGAKCDVCGTRSENRKLKPQKHDQ